MPVMSCWKYAGACPSPKGTFIYSYFQNNEVYAVLGIDDSSSRIWWYPACRSNVEKYFVPFNWEKILYFWHGPDKFPCDLIECMVISD